MDMSIFATALKGQFSQIAEQHQHSSGFVFIRFQDTLHDQRYEETKYVSLCSSNSQTLTLFTLQVDVESYCFCSHSVQQSVLTLMMGNKAWLTVSFPLQICTTPISKKLGRCIAFQG